MFNFKNLFAVLIITLSTHAIFAQSEKIDNGTIIRTQNEKVRVEFITNNIIRVTKAPLAGKLDKISLSVIYNNNDKLPVTIDENDESIILKSDKLKAVIHKNNGTIAFLDSKGNNILKEKSTGEYKHVVYDNDSGYTVQQSFELTSDEGVYGLGQHQDGQFNYRNEEVVLAQSNTEASNPFLISTNGYGILWDNYSKTIFKDNSDGAVLWSDMGDNIDYYFIAAENMDKVISGYRLLTGKAPMYGKFAYGYWQSKEHYDTQEELLTVARKYRKLQIPIDNMIQDWDYWNGNANWSGMFFDKTLFPDPQGMMDELRLMHYHAIISIWPALGPNTAIYKDMESKGYLYSNVGWAGFKYYDAYNKDATKLYWKYLKDGIYSKGLDGWWIDSTEPDVVNAMTKASSEYELKKMGSNSLGSFARYLNSFSLVMTDEIHRYWCEETSDRRAYILTRSCFAGQQRNAATTWSGDIGANWDVYRNQISAGTNHCMAGIPYWTFDIGAFVIGAYGGVFMNGGKDPSYQELYARMFQLGAFCPIFRSHGSETPREIWEMGEFTESIKIYDNLRYRLLPYIYSLAWMVTDQDYTYMRGLPMDFTSDKNTYNIDDQFMFGPSIMVNPVTDFMYHHPPEKSILVGKEFFKTSDGQPGLNASYYKDAARTKLSLEKVDPNIDILWYTGRPDYVTDSTFAITWKGKLVPKESGKHQFHLISYDPKRIILDGDTLDIVYTSVEQYTEIINLKAGKEYDFILENENISTGAARMILNWKTPSMFAKEDAELNVLKTRDVYLPETIGWYNFWTGEYYDGGQTITTPAPIETMPLFVKAGSIIPMGPFLQYSTEKPADPIELRVYTGADAEFTLYEDENDNYNYENGAYSTIKFNWNDKEKTLTIGEREGSFDGMIKDRTFKVIIVNKNAGTGLEISDTIDKEILYSGGKITSKF